MDQAEVIAGEINETPEVVTKVLRQVEVRIENNKRQTKPPPPEGGISIRAAGRKYGIRNENISRWAKRGYIPVLLRTRREIYIDEAKLTALLELYQQRPGQGRWTIRKAGLNLPSSQ